MYSIVHIIWMSLIVKNTLPSKIGVITNWHFHKNTIKLDVFLINFKGY